MKPWLLVTGLVTGLAATVGAVAAPNSMLRLSTDRRFEGSQTVPSDVFRIRELVQRVGKASDVPVFEHEPFNPDAKVPGRTLMVQLSLRGRRVVGAWQQAPGAEILESLALATNAEWRRVGSIWVLTDVPGLEHLVLLSPRNLGDEMTRYLEPLTRFSPQQVRVLGARGRLFVDDLSSLQKQAVKVRSQLGYLTGDIGPEGLDLHGSFLELRPAVINPVDPAHSVGPELTLVLRGLDGSFRGAGDYPVEKLTVVAPPSIRNQTVVPAYTPFRVASRAELPSEAADFDLDTRLSTLPTLKQGATSITAVAAIQALGNLGINVVASTAYSDRAFSLPKQTTARQLFRGIETVTGGTWRRLGATYVLHTNTLAERVALLQPAFRQEWLGNALAKLNSLLSAKQLDTIRLQGSATPDRLAREQRELLISAATAAFALDPNLSSDALQLRGVLLRLQSNPTPSRSKRALQLVLPSLAGDEVVVDHPDGSRQPVANDPEESP